MITIPTIAQLYSQVKSDLETAYGDSIPSFGKNFLRAIAMVQAGKLKLYYLVVGNLQKNIFIDTAEPEALGGTLERFGRVKLGRNPYPATSGKYVIQITGVVGSSVKSSQTFKSNDDSLSPGILYVLDATYVMISNPDNITVRCLTPGLEGKLMVGDGLTATSPIANVNAAASVISEATQPLAAEGIEDYRSKALDAYRLEPQGGAGSDYRLWAQVQGVQQSYPYAKSGAANEINLFVEATIADSTDGKGTPSAFILAAVEAAVELDPDTTRPILERGRRPLGVFQVHYLPITPKNVVIKITGFVGINADIQTLIFNAIKSTLSITRPFVDSVDILANRNDVFGINQIISVILSVMPGSTFGAITLTIAGAPATSYKFTQGDIPYLAPGAITYI
jgi:uncharacterized phage protein gp47/JayE